MSISVASPAALLQEKIRNHTAKVGIVGLGYVGLPLAVEFAQAGFEVVGIDISLTSRTSQLRHCVRLSKAES
jgi:UDP-N-acetyl-D-glucosamine dehydrogenase